MKIKAGKETEYAAYKAKNTDPYGAEVVRYTEAWADLMEKRMDQGEKLSDIRESSSHEADTKGITGFMHGCAAKALAHFWEDGEELRRAHNIATQIGTEGEEANKSGGILNPAVLCIG